MQGALRAARLSLKRAQHGAFAEIDIHNQIAHRSPEFLLIRNNDRLEFERLHSQFARALDSPPQIDQALAEGTELVAELLRFLELFLLRINARVPLIRHDLTIARESGRIALQLRSLARDVPERNRLAHRLIQSTKRLGVRDPQTLALLKRWVRSERGSRDSSATLEALDSHLGRLSSRLETALS